MAVPTAPVMDPGMLAAVLAGEFRAVARLITLIENQAPAAWAYIRELFPRTGNCITIGITGAPGSGKSTLVDRLAGAYRALDRKVAVLAVDPTSPFTGGAILGDRIRMQSRSSDDGTFIRSMATRGQLGGLSLATHDARIVLDAAGFDLVLIETVGVGQDEVEIARTADTTLVVLVPGMGDDIQAMKAGIMEIADVFVINKCDHPGVERIEASLQSMLSLSHRPDGWIPAVVKTIATDDQGIDTCLEAIGKHGAHVRASDAARKRRVQIERDRLLGIIQARTVHDLLSRPHWVTTLDRLAGEVAERKLDPYSAAARLLEVEHGGP